MSKHLNKNPHRSLTSPYKRSELLGTVPCHSYTSYWRVGKFLTNSDRRPSYLPKFATQHLAVIQMMAVNLFSVSSFVLQDMKNAIAKLDDKDLNGRRIRLVEDSQNKKRSSRSRSDSRSRSRSGSRRKSSKRSRTR